MMRTLCEGGTGFARKSEKGVTDLDRGYLIVDIGTGNTRVGICSVTGEVLAVETSDTQYFKEEVFPDSFSFDPGWMWAEIRRLMKAVLARVPDIEILAVSSISQRQGIVLLSNDGSSLLGLPNLDNRGLEWIGEITNTDKIYRRTGKWTNPIFTAPKLRGVKERQQEIWDKTAAFTSISDWIGYECTGELCFEPSQACETLLFDADEGAWSEELCEVFGIPFTWLPEVKKSGTVLGKIKPELAEEIGISAEIPFIVGGADTQMAIKGTQPELDDIVIVSGTTTPITKLVGEYSVDQSERCWINRYLDADQFIIETNTGISGLNYQRMKKIFAPDKSYEDLEDEILAIEKPTGIASFGSLIFDRVQPLPNGGFLMDAPVGPELSAAHFMFAVLFDIAGSIKHNFDVLTDISPTDKDYVLGCGGGFQGKVLPVLVADLLQKEVRIKEGFIQSGLVGGVIICNEALGIDNGVKAVIKTYKPSGSQHYLELYPKWLAFRDQINGLS